MASKDVLHEAFLEDHQHLMQGLTGVREALRAGDIAEAVSLADALDRQAGAHIAFEEADFYPILEPLLGTEFVDQLYAEHAVGKQAIHDLLERGAAEPPTAEQCRQLERRIEATLEHALSCGTLLSHLDGLDTGQRDALLAALHNHRNKPRRWTELPSRGPSDPKPAAKT